MSLFMPEIELKRVLEGILVTIKENYENNTDKTKTLLYQLYNNQSIGKFNYYTQAVELFTRGDENIRKIGTRLFFDAARASLPTIHLTLPSEQKGPADGLGIDEGYIEKEVDGDNVTTLLTRTFDTQYRLVITSDNTLEVLLIYHTLRAMLISTLTSLELVGFRNVKLGGMDIQLNSDLVPPGVFLRALTVSSYYEVSVPKLQDDVLINLIKFQAALTDNPKKYIEVK